MLRRPKESAVGCYMLQIFFTSQSWWPNSHWLQRMIRKGRESFMICFWRLDLGSTGMKIFEGLLSCSKLLWIFLMRKSSAMLPNWMKSRHETCLQTSWSTESFSETTKVSACLSTIDAKIFLESSEFSATSSQSSTSLHKSPVGPTA